ncbi:MAG: hypothetical protein K2P58_03790 [Hyphomonadaceae bacterium]|nr:hypothetical protein [Hyphomonadaceae bacterium]
MRNAVLTLLACLAACGQPRSTAPQDASAGASGVGRVAEAAFVLEPEAMVGIWSFDRSCASGDGMILHADGRASYDEWGEGTWATADENRVVLTLSRIEPGLGPTGETLTYNIDVAAPVTDDLIGQLARPDGSEPRGLNALRCPDS